MKRLLSALIASITLFGAVSGVAHAATANQTPSQNECKGPPNFCNVFFGN